MLIQVAATELEKSIDATPREHAHSVTDAMCDNVPYTAGAKARLETSLSAARYESNADLQPSLPAEF